MNTKNLTLKNEAAVIDFAENLMREILQSKDALPCAIELVGDVGAGKTTFTKGLARGLEITEEITSPTFTISKVYENSRGQKLVHYDFYRLENPGIMVEDLFENLQDPQTVTVIEWADTVSEILPANHLRLEILINDDGSRTLNLTQNLTSEH
ncbi:tRNA (adenosine(37)-N6)-threonylcarbamoyltransferase complex ATPase subunit type 1 TsaE [TM7 phylum sp. oral taxon 351]|nr:tRNA (adenosine(37)-N6)-threonylcarbamoyltransferase complex ATPase subunit type 1 TsaE [Candidatus Nanosynbacter sp.]TWO99204.1 tRNA (adenosine(37)-N6)-threonylcarbamoyltransferase complex ATPase subunit type 1 TsaE [TM7 phylum sp. oral taxon 351]